MNKTRLSGVLALAAIVVGAAMLGVARSQSDPGGVEVRVAARAHTTTEG